MSKSNTRLEIRCVDKDARQPETHDCREPDLPGTNRLWLLPHQSETVDMVLKHGSLLIAI
jgi:hypothetical protein